MPRVFPHGSHITRKREVYHYRRRLPGNAGEVTLSLGTRRYREAGHLAVLLDETFSGAWERAKAAMSDGADLNTILRDSLREFLERDLERRMERPMGVPVYASWWEPGDPGTATEADLEAIRQARASLARDLAENSPKEMGEEAERLLRQYGLPVHLLRPLTYGLIEASIRGWETAEQRTLGKTPLVFHPSELSQGNESSRREVQEASTPKGPLASALLTPFAEWARTSGGWRAGGEAQALTSLGLFLECAEIARWTVTTTRMETYSGPRATPPDHIPEIHEGQGPLPG